MKHIYKQLIILGTTFFVANVAAVAGVEGDKYLLSNEEKATIETYKNATGGKASNVAYQMGEFDRNSSWSFGLAKTIRWDSWKNSFNNGLNGEMIIINFGPRTNGQTPGNTTMGSNTGRKNAYIYVKKYNRIYLVALQPSRWDEEAYLVEIGMARESPTAGYEIGTEEVTLQGNLHLPKSFLTSGQGNVTLTAKFDETGSGGKHSQ